MNALIYCRVSSDRQVREGDGLGGQESRCRAYALHSGLTVLEVFKEAGVSGGRAERPAFIELLNYLRKCNEETAVIIDDLNRLARDVIIHRSFRVQITKNGGKLLCVNMQLEDSPEGQFVETIVAATAELEKEQNKRRVRDRQKARLEAGYWVFNNPVGYKYETMARHGKILVPDERSSKVIKRAFHDFASNKLVAQRDVLNYLRDSRLENSRGRVQKVSFEDVKRILSRKLYAGIIEYPSWNIGPRKGQHEEIVEPEIFDAVQLKLNRKSSTYRTGLDKDFPLRGFIKCRGCGELLTGAWSRGRGGKYPYYRCKNSTACSVKPKSISKHELERDYRDLLLSNRLRPEIIQLATQITLRLYSDGLANRDRKKEAIVKDVEGMEKSISSIVSKIVSTNSENVIRRLEAEVDRLEIEKHTLLLKIANFSRIPSDATDSISRVMRFLENPARVWGDGDLNQRRLVQSLMFGSTLEYSKQDKFGTTEMSIPFKLLQTRNRQENELVEAGSIR